MERLAQLLDDLDDLICMIGLFGERVRKMLHALVFACVALAIQIGGVFLALIHRPLALGVALILTVCWLYHSVTSPRLEIA